MNGGFIYSFIRDLSGVWVQQVSTNGLLGDIVGDIEYLAYHNPLNYLFSQNYPNPFNSNTIINYQLSLTNDVKLSIYDLLGQKVATLENERKRAGYHQVEWDASGFASGVYYYRIEAGEFVDVKKMVLVK
jgi:hypothetical protein